MILQMQAYYRTINNQLVYFYLYLTKKRKNICHNTNIIIDLLIFFITEPDDLLESHVGGNAPTVLSQELLGPFVCHGWNRQRQTPKGTTEKKTLQWFTTTELLIMIEQPNYFDLPSDNSEWSSHPKELIRNVHNDMDPQPVDQSCQICCRLKCMSLVTLSTTLYLQPNNGIDLLCKKSKPKICCDEKFVKKS